MKRSGISFVVVLGLAAMACGKEPHHYQSGKLLQMTSVPCGMAEKDAKTFTGELLGTDSSHKKTEEVLCQEYVLESETVTYRIRPKDDKHPVLLPVGQRGSVLPREGQDEAARGGSRQQGSRICRGFDDAARKQHSRGGGSPGRSCSSYPQAAPAVWFGRVRNFDGITSSACQASAQPEGRTGIETGLLLNLRSERNASAILNAPDGSISRSCPDAAQCSFRPRPCARCRP